MFSFYADVRPLIDAEQKDDSSSFADFSQLMEDLRQIDIRENQGVGNHPSQNDVYDFYSDEAEAQLGMPVPQARRKHSK
jgi:hypothetical protein